MADRLTVEFENHYAPWDRWFALKAYPTPDGGIAVLYREVTAAKRAEVALRQSEADLRDAQRVAKVGSWRWDAANDVVTGSEELSRIYGLDPACPFPPFAAQDGTLYPHDAWVRVGQALEAAAGGQPIELEVPALRAGAEPIWVSIRIVGERDAAGRATVMRGIVQDITDRKRAEERFQFVRRASGVGFWYCDLPFDVLDWDERVKAHFHLPPDAAVTIDTFYARIHPDDREPTRRAIEASIADRTGYDTVYRTVHPDTGAVNFIRAVGRTGYGPDGSPVRFDGVTMDVTDARRAEQAVRDSEERYRALIDLSPQLVWAADPAGRATYYSQSWQEYTGLSGEQGAGDGWAEILHPDDLPAVASSWAAAVESGTDYQSECRLKRAADGVFRWHLNRALLVRDPAGIAVRWIGVAVDIDDQKRTEQALAASEARFRGLTDTAPQVVWEATPDGRVTFLSRFFEEYAGRPADNALGEADHWGAVIRPDHLPRVAALWAEAVKGAGRYEDLYPLRRADGEYRWFQARGRLVRTPDGRPDRWVGTATDVHDRVAAEEALAATQRTLTMSLATANASVYTWEVAADRAVTRSPHPANPGVLATSRPHTLAQRLAGLHPDDRDGVKAAFDAARDSGKPYALQFRVGSADAGWRWVESRGQFEYDPDGKPLRAIGVRMDIHDRKTAEEAARRADLEFRAMADSIPQLAWMTRPDGFIDWYNSRWYEYTGTTLADMQGWGWKAVHHPDHLDRVVDRWSAHLAAGRPWEDTFPLRSAAGEYRWFLSQARPIRDEAGAIVRWFGTNTDITDLRRLQADLSASEGRFRFLDALGQATREADARGTLEVTARMLGEHLRATRCAYADVGPDGDRFVIPHDWTDGAASTVGEYSLNRFGPRAAADMRAGRPLVVRDVDAELPPADGADAFNALGIKAVICCPLVKAGRLAAMMAVHQAEPRDWTPTEVALVTEVVERSWAHVERARAEAETRAASDRFRTLTEAIPQMVWNADADGKVSYVNTRWRQYTGLDSEQAGYGWWRKVGHPADVPAADATWTAAGSACETAPVRQELRLRRAADGAYRWFSMAVVALRRPDGSLDQWIGSLSDVHDLKQAEEAVRASGARFRQLVEAVPTLVWVTDAAGGVVQLNRRWAEYTGRPTDDLHGDGWATLLHPDDAPGVVAGWQAAVRHRAPYAGEFRLRRHDGEFRWHVARGLPVPGPDGRLSQWFGTTTDIDDQKRAADLLEQQVRERTAELRRSNGELEKFAYVASHDLQEPLRKVQAFGDVLTRKFVPVLGEDGQDVVRRMQTSAARMQSLINDLLAFARITAKPRAVVPVDLTAVAAGVLGDLGDLVERTGATVHVGPLPTLPGEPHLFRQLLQNLLANACKFAAPGRPPVVQLTAVRLAPGLDPPPAFPAGWRLAVSDNGIGFEPQYAEKIFEVFQRLHGRGRYEGTGIGLAICRKIVERHGGIIAARGRPGEGAAFTVDLPDPPGEPPS
jgi:PAS domain S-box-containing protein